MLYISHIFIMIEISIGAQLFGLFFEAIGSVKRAGTLNKGYIQAFSYQFSSACIWTSILVRTAAHHFDMWRCIFPTVLRDHLDSSTLLQRSRNHLIKFPLEVSVIIG